MTLRKGLSFIGLFLLLVGILMGSCAGKYYQHSPVERIAPYPREYQEEGDFRIAVIGDSVSSGVNSDYDGRSIFGWVDFIRGYGGNPYPQAMEISLKDLWPDAVVDNFAVAGSTAYQWTFESKIRPVIDSKPDLVILFIGGNDLLAKINDGILSEEESDLIMSYYRSVLDQLQEGIPGVQTLLIGYYDLFDGLSSHLPPMVSHLRGISDYAVEMNRAIQQEATERGFLYVDLKDSFLHHAYGSDLGDPNSDPNAMVRRPLANYDIHPNSLGHRTIAMEVLASLEFHAQDLR